ncbi:DNA-J related domain-containing protein [Marinibactrum halimedae]|uniref:J domain-containing protein n=1 Tax=Marinibactrum halimedae TaxID=1444977 RepID=A0AA37T707_9GAMM|nr:DNA-J related domain-containing protein [Marinibactrum halimedae]MCD9457760.1 DnaJ domain-containing protein [Marinibactrum halimedae]GLS24866.1 hypothetical protein GCM10007877_05800 [Marinibactrum halimedae]
MNPDEYLSLPPLQRVLLQHLLNQERVDSTPYSEYDLIKILRTECPDTQWSSTTLPPELRLFTEHFLTMHSLYSLREWLAQRNYHLAISPLSITLQPLSPTYGRTLADTDPVAEYYLDIRNLEHMTVDEVNRLLASFWTRLNHQGGRESALSCLGLQHDATQEEVTRQYRKLAHIHHPDRGGNSDHFIALREAYETLKHK